MQVAKPALDDEDLRTLLIEAAAVCLDQYESSACARTSPLWMVPYSTQINVEIGGEKRLLLLRCSFREGARSLLAGSERQFSGLLLELGCFVHIQPDR